MIIRDLEDKDYTAVLSLYTELDRIHAENRPDCNCVRDCAYPKDAYDECLADQETLMLGAFSEEVLIGTVRATIWNQSGMIQGVKTVCLDNIYVIPSYRRRGIATKLYSAVEFWAREKGAVRLELHAWDFNKGAIAMYKAMGMTPQRYVFEKKL